MNERPLRLLLIQETQENPENNGFFVHCLISGACIHRVTGEQELTKTLRPGAFDGIVVVPPLSWADEPQILRLIRLVCPNCPVLVVVTSSEEPGVSGIRLDDALPSKIAEQVLLQATALENAEVAVAITDSENTIVWINRAFTHLTGYTTEEALGKPITLLRSGYHSDVFYAELLDAIRSGKMWRGEIVNRRKDGSKYYEDLTVTPVCDSTGKVTHFVSVRLDITDRKKVMAALEESESRYRMLFEQANDAIFLEDDEDRILDVNRQACDLLGYTREELLSMTVAEIQAPEVRRRQGRVIAEESRIFGDTPFEGVNLHRDGTRIPVEITNTRFSLRGRLFVLSIVRDIRERKRVEAETRRLQERLRQQHETLIRLSSSAVLSEGPMDRALRTLIAAAVQSLRVERVHLWYLDRGAGVLQCRERKPGLSDNELPRETISEKQAPEFFTALASGLVMAVNDVTSDPRVDGLRQIYLVPNSIGAFLSAPIRLRGEVVGTICLGYVGGTRGWTVDEVTFASQIADLIAQAHLNANLRRRAEEMAAITRVSREITSVSDLNHVLTMIAQHAARLSEVDNCTVFAFEPNGRLVVTGHGVSDAYLSIFRESEVIFVEDNPIACAMYRRIPISDSNLLGGTGTDFDALTRMEHLQALLVVPILKDDEEDPIGGIVLGHRHPRRFDAQEIAFMEALAQQSANAIVNARSFEFEHRQRQRTEALYVASRIIGEASRPQEILKGIVPVARLLGFATCTLVFMTVAPTARGMRTGEVYAYSESAQGAGELLEIKNFPISQIAGILQDPPSEPFRTLKLSALADVVQYLPQDLGKLLETYCISSIFVLELSIHGRNNGFVVLGSRQETPGLTQEDIQQLMTLADQVTTSLENLNLVASLKQEKARLELLYRLGQHLAAPLGIREVSRNALEELRRALGAKQGVILTLEAATGSGLSIVATASHEAEAAPVGDRQIRLAIGVGLAGWVAEHRKSALVMDIANESRWHPIPDWDYWVKSALSVALVAGDTLVGVLSLYSDRTAFFNLEHLRLAESAAATIAISLDNARLFEETQRRARDQETISRTIRALNVFEVEKAFPMLVEGLQKLTRCVRISVLLLDPGGQTVTVTNLVSPFSTLGSGTVLPVASLASWRDILAGHPSVTTDMREVVHFETARILYEAGIESSVSLPLISSNRVIGMLVLGYAASKDLRFDQLPALQQVSDALAIAVENGRLFRAEREKRELAEALEEAAAAVRSDLDPDQVLDRILSQVERVVAGDAFNIMLVAGPEGVVVRWRGYSYLPDQNLYQRRVLVENFPVLLQMIDTGAPVFISDTLQDAAWVRAEGPEWRRSYVGAPIRTTQDTVGFLNVTSAIPNRFTYNDAQRLQAFANHAATAIETSRLVQALREYSEHLEMRVELRTAELRAQYARLDAVLRSTSDSVIVTDSDGDILQMNPVAEHLLSEGLTPEDADRLRDTVRALSQDAVRRPDIVLELHGLDLQLSAAPITPTDPHALGWGSVEEGDPSAVVVVHDVSHLKALDRMKSQFVSNVSHELRTPVATIKLYAQLLRQGPPEKRNEYLVALDSEIEREARLIEDILQFSRIDAGRLDLQMRLTDFNLLVESMVVSYQILAESKGLSLTYVSPQQALMANLDQLKIRQVITNLLVNAIQYTPEGGSVQVSTTTQQAKGRACVVLIVQDTGIGIPPEEVSQVFERFFRGAEPRERQIAGTGLGLAIAREIVVLHGGWVTVESEVGKGATFMVFLPRAQS
ncbi:MAG: GAF domain-containing protein [Anaerolineae bacterium]|nr:GAF domain-containing protein [Anaerolineae bacterium]